MTNDDAVERVEAATPPEASVIPESSPPPAARRSRRFRVAISLRTMMVLVLVSGVWMAWQVNRARATRRAIATIHQAGGYVDFNDGTGPWDDKPRLRPPKWLVKAMGEEYFFDVVGIQALGAKDWNDHTTRTLTSFPALREFRLPYRRTYNANIVFGQLARMLELREIVVYGDIRDTEATDLELGLGRLASLKKLRILYVHYGRLGAKDLEALATLPELRELSLNYKLGEAETQALGRFGRLESLSFWGGDNRLDPRHTGRLPVESWQGLKKLEIAFYALSVDDMKAIASLPRLEELSIFSGETENEHLLLFAGMTGLKKLELDACYVTPAGVASLQQHLPSLSITGLRIVETKMSASLLDELREMGSERSDTSSPLPRVDPDDGPRP